MLCSFLPGRRPLLGRLTVVAVAVSLMLIGVSPGAVAAIDTDDACPDPPNAGFLDIAEYPRHVRDAINCLADYDVTEGTSDRTFSPEFEVTRWQMALFLIRQAEVHDIDLPGGSSQGFVDIGDLSLSTQRAINQLVRLDITEGTTATTFSPYDPVPRWQMALFITRLLDAAGMTMPSGSSQGFSDVPVLPSATERAINQLAQLDVTEGTAIGQFSPYANVTRWQMALFRTRALQADGVTPREIVAERTRTSSPKAGAPDLQNVRVVDEDEDDTRLSFEFDEAVGDTVKKGDFWLVGWDGTLTSADAASNTNNNDYDEVQADFETAVYENAVAAAVTPGAARDIDGHENTMGSDALQRVVVDSIDWPDDYPELVSVGRYDEGDETVEFEFDLEDALEDANEDLTVGSASDFYLVDEDGEVYTGHLIADIEHNVVTVDFSDPGLDETEWNGVVRGFVAENTVTEPGGLKNLPVAVDVSDSGRSDTPYISDVDLDDIDNGVIVFEFNQGLQPFENESGHFKIVLHDGTVYLSDDEDRDVGQTDEVIVQFNGGAQLPSDLVVYATVLDGAVDGFNSGLSGPDTYRMKYTFDGGETAGPDLVSSEGTGLDLAEDVFKVVLTFDEDLDETNGAFDFDPSTDLLGWDEEGHLVDISGGEMSIDDDVMTIEFDETDDGFDELDDDEVVWFGVYANEVADEYGFTSYYDGVRFDRDK